MDLPEERETERPPIDDTQSIKNTPHHLATAEIPPVDDLAIHMPSFTPQQSASLENMMNTTIKAGLDERLGSQLNVERDSAVDLSEDNRVDPINDARSSVTNDKPRADSLTIEMPGFDEGQVPTLETMLKMTVKTVLDERLGPQKDVGVSDRAPVTNDGDMVDEDISPRGSARSRVNHLGVNGVADGSRFAC